MKFDKTKLHSIDKLIRTGHHGQAAQLLDEVLATRIPRPHLFEVAGLCRRLSRSQTGIALLNPLVRPSEKKPVEATEEERIEYAACLIRLGGLNEAFRLLESVSPERHASSLLFRGFAHIARWDFLRAAEFLLAFLAHPHHSAYDALVARVNLGLGYVFLEDRKRAAPILREAVESAEAGGYRLLHSNALELLAQAHILREDYAKARQALNEAESLLDSSSTIDAFFIQKDKAVLALLESPDRAASLRALDKIRREAETRGFWEQARDCSYYLAIANPRPAHIHKLYFGTPFAAYRAQLLKKLGLSEAHLPETYRWRLGRSRARDWIHVQTGENSFTSNHLKDGQVPQRLLAALAHDFFRPRRLLELFDLAFPNEHYSPTSSPDKIHQGIKRLREFLAEAKVPLLIQETKGLYHLACAPDHALDLICPRAQATPAVRSYKLKAEAKRISPLWEKFLRHADATNSDGFTAGELAQVMGVSARTALRMIQYQERNNRLARHGKGRWTRYVLKS
jgi:tetratricopeptide (TPR) repeat protein